MSGWTKFRDNVLKPAVAIVATPVTGGASLALLAADYAQRAQKENLAEATQEAERLQQKQIEQQEKDRAAALKIAEAQNAATATAQSNRVAFDEAQQFQPKDIINSVGGSTGIIVLFLAGAAFLFMKGKS